MVAAVRREQRVKIECRDAGGRFDEGIDRPADAFVREVQRAAERGDGHDESGGQGANGF